MALSRAMAAPIAALFLLLAVCLPQATAARPVPGGSSELDARPEWPCCRQYEAPPTVVAHMHTARKPLQIIPGFKFPPGSDGVRVPLSHARASWRLIPGFKFPPGSDSEPLTNTMELAGDLQGGVV